MNEIIDIMDGSWLSKKEAKKLASWWNQHDKLNYYFVKPIRVLLPFRKVIRFTVVKQL